MSYQKQEEELQRIRGAAETHALRMVDALVSSRSHFRDIIEAAQRHSGYSAGLAMILQDAVRGENEINELATISDLPLVSPLGPGDTPFDGAAGEKMREEIDTFQKGQLEKLRVLQEERAARMREEADIELAKKRLNAEFAKKATCGDINHSEDDDLAMAEYRIRIYEGNATVIEQKKAALRILFPKAEDLVISIAAGELASPQPEKLEIMVRLLILSRASELARVRREAVEDYIAKQPKPAETPHMFYFRILGPAWQRSHEPTMVQESDVEFNTLEEAKGAARKALKVCVKEDVRQRKYRNNRPLYAEVLRFNEDAVVCKLLDTPESKN